MDRIGSEALWTVLNDFSKALSSMAPEVAEQFDDTFLQDMSRRGLNIVACAALLSMGMVDQATTFAENCGGGGAHSSSGWGRNPKDDDREWMRRCLAQSRIMMKPAGRHIKR